MAFPWMVNFFNPPRYEHRLTFDGVTSTLAQFKVYNDSLVGLEIEYIYLNWPSGNLGVFTAQLDVTTIASGGDASPPTEFPDDVPWFGTPADRTVQPKTESDLEFSFGGDAAGTGYSLTVRFTNGVELSVDG